MDKQAIIRKIYLFLIHSFNGCTFGICSVYLRLLRRPIHTIRENNLSTNNDPIIAHADLDAFFASVEQRDNSKLMGKPVIVGGKPESRGVVAACSYEARQYGVRASMPLWTAYKRCPKAIFVHPRHDIYREVSNTVMNILKEHANKIEPVSFDEAFLDLTNKHRNFNEAISLGRRIQTKVQKTLKLPISIGIANSKSVSKIACQIGKPQGLLAVQPGQEKAFLAPLEVRSIWGIGPKTDKKMRQIGVRTVGDLLRVSYGKLISNFGAQAYQLKALAQGIDYRQLSSEPKQKSVGFERTFELDVSDLDTLVMCVETISQDLSDRLVHCDMQGRTIAIKLRYTNFKTITRQKTLPAYTANASTIADLASDLLIREFRYGDRIRMLGLQISSFNNTDHSQLTFPFDNRDSIRQTYEYRQSDPLQNYRDNRINTKRPIFEQIAVLQEPK